MAPLKGFYDEKSERMNQMLRYINQKQQFTLQDLMQEFQISKRTAIRDIASLEELGAPIYAEYGRYGGYRLLQQMQLPPYRLIRESFMPFILPCRPFGVTLTCPFRLPSVRFMRNS